MHMPMEIKPSGQGPAEHQELTVSQLTGKLKQLLEREPELVGFPHAFAIP